jgi:hypothetical protein
MGQIKMVAHCVLEWRTIEPVTASNIGPDAHLKLKQNVTRAQRFKRNLPNQKWISHQVFEDFHVALRRRQVQGSPSVIVGFVGVNCRVFLNTRIIIKGLERYSKAQVQEEYLDSWQ